MMRSGQYSIRGFLPDLGMLLDEVKNFYWTYSGLSHSEVKKANFHYGTSCCSKINWLTQTKLIEMLMLNVGPSRIGSFQC